MYWSVSRRVLVGVLVVFLGTAFSSSLTAAPIGPDVIARFSAKLTYTLRLWQQQPATSSVAKGSQLDRTVYIDPDGETTKGGNPATMGSCVDPNGFGRPCPGGG